MRIDVALFVCVDTHSEVLVTKALTAGGSDGSQESKHKARPKSRIFQATNTFIRLTNCSQENAISYGPNSMNFTTI